MKTLARFVLSAAFIAAAFIGGGARPALAGASCSVAHVFVTGETLIAVNLNANPTAIVACINALKVDNTNVGPAGFYASQIIPTTTAQGTFGPSGYTIPSGAATQTPLTLTGYTTQTADLLDIYTSSASTTAPAFAISAGGGTLLNGDCPLSWFGAVANGTTDASAAWAAAFALWQTGFCTSINVDSGTGTYLVDSAIVPTTSTTMPRLRIHGNGPDVTLNSSGQTGITCALDLRYTGADGLNSAKINFYASGSVEFDHLSICDKASPGDHLPFVEQTYSTVYGHDLSFWGDATQVCNTTLGTGCPTQDGIYLGSQGALASSVNITSSSTTLTIGGGDQPFTSAMVGWTIDYQQTPTSTPYNATIATFVSSTQVTLSAAATVTITNGVSSTHPYTPAGAASPFVQTRWASLQGYRTSWVNVKFANIRRGFTWGAGANNVLVDNVLFDTTCGDLTSGYTFGGGSAFLFPDIPGAGQIAGNIIRDSYVEMPGYRYAVYVGGYADANKITGVSGYDIGALQVAMVHYSNGNAYGNQVTAGLAVKGNIPYIDPSGGNGQFNTFFGGVTNSGSSTYAFQESQLTPFNVYLGNTTQAFYAYGTGSGVGFEMQDNATNGANLGFSVSNSHSYKIIDDTASQTLLTLNDTYASSNPGGLSLNFAGAQFVAQTQSATGSSPCNGGYAYLNGVVNLTGSGVPTCSASNGSTYSNYAGGPGARFYLNTTGATSVGTTWTAEW